MFYMPHLYLAFKNCFGTVKLCMYAGSLRSPALVKKQGILFVETIMACGLASLARCALTFDENKVKTTAVSFVLMFYCCFLC